MDEVEPTEGLETTTRNGDKYSEKEIDKKINSVFAE